MQAICSSVVTGGEVGVDVEVGYVAGDVPPMVALVRYIRSTTTPTRNRQLPTKVALHNGRSRHFFGVSVKISA